MKYSAWCGGCRNGSAKTPRQCAHCRMSSHTTVPSNYRPLGVSRLLASGGWPEVVEARE